jgi:cystathionine beta-synthase
VALTDARRPVTGAGPAGRPPVAALVTDLIGHTPLLELARTPRGARLLLKLEQFNPTGAAKIRMARQMVLDAEARGRLRPGGRIIEPTSGNTGLGLAVVAAERGYRFTAVVDHHAAGYKLRAMRAMGAELVFVTDGDEEGLATSAREDLAAALAADDEEAVFLQQHDNLANGDGYHPVAHELVAALGDDLHVLIGAVGTGGSLCGTAAELRALDRTVTVVGVEPVGSIAFGGPGGDYYQSGTGTPPGAVISTSVAFDLIDHGAKVSDVEAFATARVVARRAGLLLGGSAGGVVHEALGRLSTLGAGSTMVALVCDGGEKYLDTVFDDGWMTARQLIDPVVERAVDRRLAPLRAAAVGSGCP